ncbi:MAG: mechanosensitive ion channel [Lachnospiraceae bacterium]|nr:mechanosensitive ion channel [Lachnospiraceae bacterium]
MKEANLSFLESVIDPNGNIDVGLLERYMEQIPEKALQLGIKVVLAFLVLVIGMKVIKWVRKILRKALTKGNADIGVIQFLDALVRFSLIAVLILLVASGFGLETTSIITVLGSAGIAIGLAIQGSLSNFAGGVLILLLKPFKVGDYIKEDTKGNEGTVIEISLFYTKLRTYDEKIIVLPNGNLANNSLTNVTGQELRKLEIKVGISYEADIKKAKEILLSLAEKEESVLKDKEKKVFVDQLADSSVILGLRCYVSSDDYWEAKWKLTEDIKYAFDQNDIGIPFQQLDIHIKNE